MLRYKSVKKRKEKKKVLSQVKAFLVYCDYKVVGARRRFMACNEAAAAAPERMIKTANEKIFIPESLYMKIKTLKIL